MTRRSTSVYPENWREIASGAHTCAYGRDCVDLARAALGTGTAEEGA